MSWAEDMGLDNYDPDDDFQSDSAADEWEDVNYNVVKITKLDTNHLRNIIRGLEAGKEYWGQGDKLGTLKAELAKRTAVTQPNQPNEETQ